MSSVNRILLLLISVFVFLCTGAQASAQIGNGPLLSEQWNLSQQEFYLVDGELTEHLFGQSQFRAMLDEVVSIVQNPESEMPVPDAHLPIEANQLPSDKGSPEPVENPRHESLEVIPASFEQELSAADDFTDEFLPPTEILEFEWPAVTTHGRSILASNTVAELLTVVDEERLTIEEDTHLTEGQRTARLQQLSAADEWLQKASQYQRRISLYDQQIAESSKATEEIRNLLSQPITPSTPPTGDDITSAHLNRDLQTKRSQLASQKAEIESYNQAIKNLGDRTMAIPRERAEANERLRNIEEAILHNEDVDLEDLGGAESNSELRLLLQYARKRATELELRMLDAEVEQQEIAGGTFPIERDLVSREIHKLESEIEAWEVAVTETRKSEARRESELAREAVMNAHPQLRDIAERNQVLVNERSDLYEKLQELEQEISQTRNQFDDVSAQRKLVQEKIEAAGLTNATGIMLVNMRRSLLSPGESYVRIQQVESEFKKINLQVVALTEERQQIAQPRKLIEEQLNIDPDDADLFATAGKFIDAKRSYLDQLLTDYRSYRGLLADVNVERQRLIDELDLTIKYANENALWIRSASTIGLTDFTDAAAAARSFSEPQLWNGLFASAIEKGNSKPLGTGVVGLGLFLLFVFNVKLKSSLKRQGDQ